MMLMPRRNYSLFDDLFRDDFFDKKMPSLMKTDIKEMKDKYQLEVDLPGYKKENINLELEEILHKVFKCETMSGTVDKANNTFTINI